MKYLLLRDSHVLGTLLYATYSIDITMKVIYIRIVQRKTIFLASRLCGDTGCLGTLVSSIGRQIQNGTHRWCVRLFDGRRMPSLGRYR